jgi:hypothetical protein
MDKKSGEHHQVHTVSIRKSTLIAISLLILQVALSVSFASDEALVAKIYKSPPPPCISKSIDDTSSGMRMHPYGITREEVRSIMAWMASKFVTSGRQYLTSKHIDTVYTAVFYENEPMNEIGIYGYRFISPMQPSDFKAGPEFHGRLFVLNGELLILLWHEESSRTAGCFSAIEKILEFHAKDRK